MKTYTKKGKLNKRSRKYIELHDLWLDTEEYLSMNRLKPIEKINKTFYKFLVKHKFSDSWDCWSICEKYITGKSYRPNSKFKIVPFGDYEFALKTIDGNKVVAIRNTERQIKGVLKYLEEK